MYARAKAGSLQPLGNALGGHGKAHGVHIRADTADMLHQHQIRFRRVEHGGRAVGLLQPGQQHGVGDRPKAPRRLTRRAIGRRPAASASIGTR